ncbi:CgeB family protein [Lachnotalea glycerini]|uniref:Spore maturation protein CgeB n=1 Tax=Lachnotalea glycerini TaxID=1763509 RepID=A0A371JGD2_9FIRM|nr:DUF3880 domain-containing protein [Lachnotalea glycerini]RDY31747.1 spore maturation protein CgeB [Lachnotalea glycerini]
MNILLCSWANIFEPDIIDALQSMGHQIYKITLPISDPFSDSYYMTHLSRQMIDMKCDFVFSVNYIPVVSMACSIHQMKYVSWIADSPCFELNSYTISNTCNYIFIFDKILYQSCYKESPQTVYYLPLGSNTKRLDNIRLYKHELDKYQSDISFVGSLYTFRSKYNKVMLPAYWKGYFEGIIESQLLIYGYNLIHDTLSDDAVNAFAKAADWNDQPGLMESGKLCRLDIRSIIADNYIGRECSRRERFRAFNEISKHFHFDLYTNESTSELPLVNSKGTIEPFEDAFKIYKASKINLNITSKTIQSGLPLRIFDILGAGGFLITNFQTELPEYFEIDKDLVVYENLNDLIHKISYYLSHEEERLTIAQNGYQKVKKYYQFQFQIQKMLAVVFESN